MCVEGQGPGRQGCECWKLLAVSCLQCFVRGLGRSWGWGCDGGYSSWGKSCSSILWCWPAVCASSSLRRGWGGRQTRCVQGGCSMLIDLVFLFRRSPHAEFRSGSSAPVIFFADLTTQAKSLLFSAVQPAYHTLQPWQRMLSIVLLYKFMSRCMDKAACLRHRRTAIPFKVSSSLKYIKWTEMVKWVAYLSEVLFR